MACACWSGCGGVSAGRGEGNDSGALSTFFLVQLPGNLRAPEADVQNFLNPN